MIACVFPGQGSQRSGMGRQWNKCASWEVVATVSDVTGCHVARLLLDADDVELRDTRNTQLALYTLELVMWSELARLGLKPAILAGHSVGELVALVAAGAMSPEDGARLVSKRAKAMDEASQRSPGAMAAVVGLSVTVAESLCSSLPHLWLSADNAEGHVTVAGLTSSVEAMKTLARDAGATRVLRLNVGGAFHTPFMADALPPYHAQLCATRLQRSVIDVVANVDAQCHRDPDEWRPLLLAQITSRVRWRDTITRIARTGDACFVEVGPGRTLSALAQRTAGAHVVPLDGPDPEQRLSELQERCIAAGSRDIVVRASTTGVARIPATIGAITTEGEVVGQGAVVAWIGDSPHYSPCAGWLVDVLVSNGETVLTGQPLARIYR